MDKTQTHTIRIPSGLSASSLASLKEGESWNRFAQVAIEREIRFRSSEGGTDCLVSVLEKALELAKQGKEPRHV